MVPQARVLGEALEAELVSRPHVAAATQALDQRQRGGDDLDGLRRRVRAGARAVVVRAALQIHTDHLAALEPVGVELEAGQIIGGRDGGAGPRYTAGGVGPHESVVTELIGTGVTDRLQSQPGLHAARVGLALQNWRRLGVCDRGREERCEPDYRSGYDLDLLKVFLLLCSTADVPLLQNGACR